MMVYKVVAEETHQANRKVLSQHLIKNAAYGELGSGKFKIHTWGFDYVRYYFECKPGFWQNVIVEEGDYEYVSYYFDKPVF
jgi:hypothetical protein